MINTIIDIIHSLNGGSVIPFQSDETTTVDLGNDAVKLFVDSSGTEKKYYYFAAYKMDDEKKDNLGQIERNVFGSEVHKGGEKPNPSDSYMILFWKVDAIDEKIFPYVINVEENEFFYKKYVFYYTEQELAGFKKWYRDMQMKGDVNLENVLNLVRNLDEESDHVKFFIRLLIKVPFLNPVFPKAVMEDFDKMVQAKINVSKKKQQEVKSVNDIFLRAINDDEDMEKLSDIIYQKFMEEK
ncbi:MAG: hypothetical protein K2N73_07860 [Lachnospiraceae bacterium]|nr:hypothetical protein [Lachnospiraceae bacterium]